MVSATGRGIHMLSHWLLNSARGDSRAGASAVVG